jgi:glycosyltransferase involved in cell wall biosynthesis
MPVYNGEKHVKQAIKGVLNQTFKQYKFLIINDGSTDNSEEIILSYSDPRIQYQKNEKNLGLIKTLNKGLQLCKGDYIVRMDADDVSLPHRLERLILFMEQNQEVGIAGSYVKTIEVYPKIVNYPTTHFDILERFTYQCAINHPSTIWRNSVLKDYQFDEQFPHAEDYELWTRLILKTKFAIIPEVLLEYRVHSNSVSSLNKIVQDENSINIQLRFFSNLGVSNLSITELESYKTMCYADWAFFKDPYQLTSLSIMLNKWLNANQENKLIPIDHLDHFLSEKWYHLIRNTSKKSSDYIMLKCNRNVTFFIRVIKLKILTWLR